MILPSHLTTYNEHTHSVQGAVAPPWEQGQLTQSQISVALCLSLLTPPLPPVRTQTMEGWGTLPRGTVSFSSHTIQALNEGCS